ncbi:unnamed protein product [Ectocarpus sp. 8 AP-2014]
MILDAGVVVGTCALVVLVWNLGRMNNVMKELENQCCEEERTPDTFEIEAKRGGELVLVKDEEDDGQTTEEAGERSPTPTREDVAMLKAAMRREHFQRMVPGTLTPDPWRSIFYGRGRPTDVGPCRSLSSSGHSMAG